MTEGEKKIFWNDFLTVRDCNGVFERKEFEPKLRVTRTFWGGKILFFFVVGLFVSRENLPNESRRCDNAASVYTPNHSADYGGSRRAILMRNLSAFSGALRCVDWKVRFAGPRDIPETRADRPPPPPPLPPRESLPKTTVRFPSNTRHFISGNSIIASLYFNVIIILLFIGVQVSL